MPSSTAKRNRRGTRQESSTLQALRRRAGFRSAKDFAAKVGIPESTYSRYERAPEGPSCGIPLPNAWAMADELGCSIDLVVGRVDPEEYLAGGSLDERVAAMNVLDREIVTSFIEFIEEKSAATSRRGRI